MSLILEALRKSEAERRRGNAPDVAVELPPNASRGARANPSWLWPAVAIGVLALVAAIWWSTRSPPVAATAPAPVARMPGDAPAPAAPIAAPAVVPRPRTPPAGITPPVADAPPPDGPTPQASPAAPAATPAAPARTVAMPAPATPAPARPAAATPPPASASLPIGMPGVKLSMHMWNDAPTRRFVILNGQRMGEGNRIGDLQVVEIRRDGVVVERDGQQALVPLR